MYLDSADESSMTDPTEEPDDMADTSDEEEGEEERGLAFLFFLAPLALDLVVFMGLCGRGGRGLPVCWATRRLAR